MAEVHLPGERQTGSSVSNLDLTYRAPDGRYSISAYVNNVEDNAIKATSFVQPVVGLPLAILRPPRTYGLRVSFDIH